MTKGLEIRAQIDTELVKGLLVINGGGSVALVAFLPTILGKPEYAPLSKAVLLALMSFQVGLITAVNHNRLRRVCSLEYEKHNYKPPPCKIFPISLFKFKNDAPCVCRVSVMFMWVSILSFLIAGIFVINGGFSVLNKLDIPNVPVSVTADKNLKRTPNDSLKQDINH